LLAYSKALTKKNPDGTFARIGFIPNFGNSWLYLYAWQNGGEFMSPDGRRSTLNDPNAVGALRYMTEVYDALGGYDAVNIFQTGFQTNEQDPFYTGKVAMVIHGSWVVPSIARYAPDLDFGVVPAPVPEERLRGLGRFAGQDQYITWVGGFSFAMPKNARHPEEAWKFIRWMTSEECYVLQNRAQKAYNERQGRPFVFAITANHKINQTLLREFPLANPRLAAAQKAYVDILPVAKYRPVTFIGQTLWDAHVRAFERAVSHAQTPQAALDEQTVLVQKELDKAFAREKLPTFSFTGPVLAIGGLLIGGLAFGAVRVRRQLGNSRQARSEALAGFMMASPWIFGFVLLTAGPILASILFAFCDYDVLHAPRFVGTSNFKRCLPTTANCCSRRSATCSTCPCWASRSA
jgi:multiple sugar transport system permease protein